MLCWGGKGTSILTSCAWPVESPVRCDVDSRRGCPRGQRHFPSRSRSKMPASVRVRANKLPRVREIIITPPDITCRSRLHVNCYFPNSGFWPNSTTKKRETPPPPNFISPHSPPYVFLSPSRRRIRCCRKKENEADIETEFAEPQRKSWQQLLHRQGC